MNKALDSHQFGSTAFQPTLSGLFWFEFRSRLGRLFSKPRVPQHAYINLGSGTEVSDQFENVDFYFSGPRKGRHAIVGHDLRRPLPYGDESFSGAFSEHAIEHLFPSDAHRLLREVKRILRPGAVFRCAVPDLAKYVDYYVGKHVNPEFQKFRSGHEAIWSLTQNWGHLSVWDCGSLVQAALDAGFASASEREFRVGKNSDLLIDRADRRWETLYVEAVR